MNNNNHGTTDEERARLMELLSMERSASTAGGPPSQTNSASLNVLLQQNLTQDPSGRQMQLQLLQQRLLQQQMLQQQLAASSTLSGLSPMLLQLQRQQAATGFSTSASNPQLLAALKQNLIQQSLMQGNSVNDMDTSLQLAQQRQLLLSGNHLASGHPLQTELEAAQRLSDQAMGMSTNSLSESQNSNRGVSALPGSMSATSGDTYRAVAVRPSTEIEESKSDEDSDDDDDGSSGEVAAANKNNTSSPNSTSTDKKPKAEEDDKEVAIPSADSSAETFPFKLHRMMTDVYKEGLTDVVSFLEDDSAFFIHKPKTFVESILPKYFTSSRLSSFQRQLNLYSFRRIGDGPMKGSYKHDKFVKGKPELCKLIKRKKTETRQVPHLSSLQGMDPFVQNYALSGGLAPSMLNFNNPMFSQNMLSLGSSGHLQNQHLLQLMQQQKQEQERLSLLKFFMDQNERNNRS